MPRTSSATFSCQLRRLVLCIAVFFTPQLPPASAAEVPLVAAASDLQYALADVAEAFSRASGRSVKLTLGSSGNFTRQIIQGAPFEIFFSADEDYVHELVKRSLTLGEGALYAVGRLVVFVPNASRVKADAQLKDVSAAIDDGRLRRLAIANPEHAPYGRAARSVLMHQRLWEKLQGRLVLGENVSQTAQFALSGSVDAGMIAHSLVVAGPMGKQGSFAIIPEEWHAPLRQRMVLLRGAGETARSFYAFVQSSQGRRIFERYGFTLPTGN